MYSTAQHSGHSMAGAQQAQRGGQQALVGGALPGVYSQAQLGREAHEGEAHEGVRKQESL
jgi:hypothetical protein